MSAVTHPVRAARLRSGIKTPTALAEIVEISPAQVYNIESGRTVKPTEGVLIEISKALGRDPVELGEEIDAWNEARAATAGYQDRAQRDQRGER